MPHGCTYFESKGCCIYCGAQGVKLTNEHIVPLSLGGNHIIRKASCKHCAIITAKFEQKIARDLWGDARTAFDAPSRRKKSRPKSIQIQHPSKPGVTTNVPAAEYPGVLVFYKMGKAGLLENLPESLDISVGWKLVAIDDHLRRESFRAKYKAQPTAQFRHVPREFGQLLAKIGYGQVLTSLDPGEFTPFCVPYILGTRENVSFVVGGSLDDQKPEPLGYKLETAAFGDEKLLMLMAIIRLYAHTHAPVYHVVVGDVRGTENVKRVVDRLKVETVVQRTSSLARNKKLHWMPSSFPLLYWTSD